METLCKLAQVHLLYLYIITANRQNTISMQNINSISIMQVDMYKEKLRERDRRKTVVKELGLIEAFFKVICLFTWDFVG